MIWKVLQKQIELQNVRHKGDKEDNDTLIIHYEDSAPGTYNEKPKNTWWNIQTQLGMISPQESSKEMWVTRSLLSSSNTRSRPKSNWLHCDKEWKMFFRSYKNIKSMHQRTPDNLILTKRADKTPRGFAIITAPTDTLPAGVEKKFEIKKSRKYRTKWWLKNA